MSLATILCFASLVFVLFQVDPYEAPMVAFVFFYVSVFFAIMGTSSLVTFLVLWARSRESEAMFQLVRTSFRVSILVAILTTSLLYLQAKALLSLWNMIILGVFLLCVFILWYTQRARTAKQSIDSSFSP